MSASDLPQLVRSRVRYARRGLASVRLLESVAVALAAATGAAAAAVFSGASLSQGGPWWAAALCALLTGATWGIELHLGGRALAARIDRALGQGGALLTAWEVEGGARVGRIGGLLARSVAEKVPARRMLRAVLPVSAPLFALPFAGATLLFLALEDVRSRPIDDDLQLLSARVGDQLADFSQANRGAPPEGAEDLSQQELSELAGLARAAGGLAAREPEGGEELEELRERIEALEERLPPESEIRSRLEKAEDTLDSALMALERARPEEDREGEEGSGAARETGGEVDAFGSRPGSGLASDVVDVTMVNLESHTSAEARTSERGVLSGPAWSEAYDAIVARWIASRREQR